MAITRKINLVLKSKPTLEGAGVHLRRAFGFHETKLFDPFLLLDDFRSDDPDKYLSGFPWHPHRGIETITYMLAGEIDHGDSMGNQGVIAAGDVQWMTAGSGIIHQEMPRGDVEGRMYGFQLWANLPKAHKMMDPRYQEIKSSQIPEITLANGVRVRVICGDVNGHQGPVQNIMIQPSYLDVTLPARASFIHPTQPGHTVIAYIYGGQGTFCEPPDPLSYEVEGGSYFDFKGDPWLDDGSLVVYHDGDQIKVSAGDKGVSFLLISGQPIREPVAWYGPIVMNTTDELRIAFAEYQNGTFIKSHSPK